MIKRSLELSDISIDKIFEASNGEEGLKLMTTEDINLVLLDINMPVMDGVEMLKKMQTSPDFRNLPVLIVSTQNNLHRVESLEGKAAGFLLKPFTPEHLRNVVKKVTNTLDEDTYVR